MPASVNGQSEALRELLRAPGGIALPGCYDVLSAMLLEQAGFSACFLSGYGVAASSFGNPDIGLTSLSETASITKNVVNAIHVPLVVDVDNGYGNEDNVIRTVVEVEQAGAAAIVLEDQVFPKRCGHTGVKAVIPLAQYLRKLECALNARRTPLVVVARTDAANLDEAIARAKAFHSAGADVTMVDGLSSLEAMKRVAGEVPGLKQINLIYGGKTPILPVPELHDLGFKLVLYSTPALYIVANTLRSAMKVLHETGDLGSLSPMSMPFASFQDFIETRYLRRVNTTSIAPSIPDPDLK